MTQTDNDSDEIERTKLANSAEFRRILETAEQQIAEGKGIPHEEFWRQMEEEDRRKP